MPLKLASLTQTCEACPSQWEGTAEDGSEIYVRYRWGWLRLEVNGEVVFRQQFGDSLDGLMEEEDMLEHLKKHIAK